MKQIIPKWFKDIGKITEQSTWKGKYRSMDNTIGKERGNSYRKNEDLLMKGINKHMEA